MIKQVVINEQPKVKPSAKAKPSAKKQVAAPKAAYTVDYVGLHADPTNVESHVKFEGPPGLPQPQKQPDTTEYKRKWTKQQLAARKLRSGEQWAQGAMPGKSNKGKGKGAVNKGKGKGWQSQPSMSSKGSLGKGKSGKGKGKGKGKTKSGWQKW